MSDTATAPEGVEQRPLKEYSEQAYLDYSMYVILDRALPHIGDGLKPVQRRIVYAMSELGLTAGVKFKKSARTIGDVLGKFHPHGETACYEAMVLMAQPFSFRYPLVDGQGNWGAIDDPKSFAAMRYTEARLSRFAAVLLSELGQGTVDWVPNFDGTLEEPALFPARLPHVLLNGASGIAVGMATDLLPHNAREVASACVRLLDEPKATVEHLCEHVPGPDFPTEAEIVTPRGELLEIYRTGAGSVRARARYERENGVVVITALPYQTFAGRVLEQIASQMLAKKLPMLEDLRDESDGENPTRLVLVPRSNRVDVDQMMSHLFATTDLERSYRVNMNVIGVDGRPRVKDLRTLLREWLDFRIATVRRRLEHRLERVEARLHRLAGLLVAYLNIDEVIAIIRSEDEPKPVLMDRFGLTDLQAEAILELRLRHLARLEEVKIRAEEEELGKERDRIAGLLGSKRRLKRLVRDEIVADAEEFGDDRRSPIVARDAARALAENALIPSEATTVILSSHGWVRAAKGHDVKPEGLSYRSGDGFRSASPGRSNQPAIFIDSHGRAYSLPAHSLPSARGQGEPLTGRLNPPDGATFEGVMLGAPGDTFLLAADSGHGFLAALEVMASKNKAGKAILTVPAGAGVLEPRRVANPESDTVAVVSAEGRLLVFPARELPRLNKGKGVKLIQIPRAKLEAGEDRVRAMAVLPPAASLTVHAGRRHLTLKPGDIEHYRLGRGRRGRLLPRGLRRVDAVEVQPPAAGRERRPGEDGAGAGGADTS